MSELVKDFIKLIAVLLVILMIIDVIVDPKGILASVFSLKSYAEPITLLDHVSAAIETASYTPGETSISIRTSGLPYIIQIYKENGKYYASIDTSLVEQETNVKFQAIEPQILISDCDITEQKLVLTEGLIQDIVIRKTMIGTKCSISIDSKGVPYDFNVSVSPEYAMVPNGTTVSTEVTVSLVEGTIAPEPVTLTAGGAPPGVDISFSKDTANPSFISTIFIHASASAAPGNYTITITGTSGNVERSTTLEIEVAKVLLSFVLETKTDIINKPLTGVEVNVDNDIRYTREHTEYVSNTVYGLLPDTLYHVGVENPFNSRFFSHFRDYDCDGLENVSDVANNPYGFNMGHYNRIVTAFYKAFTQIRNLEFDNITSIISGNLLDEDFNPIIINTTKYDTCGVPTQVYPNRNVTIEYLDVCTNSWKSISSVTSSFTKNIRLYDNFDKGNSNGWITMGIWNVTNGEFNNSGVGDEQAKSVWNYWNGSAGDNSNLEISVKILSGSNISIKILDSINEYYLQTNDSYNNVYLWVNGALKQNSSLTGINPNQWNTWRIKQNESYLEFYINNKKIIKYNGAPLMNFGRVMIETLNTKAVFDNITAYDGSWSYNFNNIRCSVKKIRAAYLSSDWYYNDTFANIDIDPATVLCKLTVNTQIDVPSLPLPGIEVNVSDGVLNKKYSDTTSGPLATAIYYLTATRLPIHNITVDNALSGISTCEGSVNACTIIATDTTCNACGCNWDAPLGMCRGFGIRCSGGDPSECGICPFCTWESQNARNFSHFYDQDCDPNNIGYYSDKASNPYWFSICRDKNITVQYKTNTYIANNSGEPDTFNFNFSKSNTISGKLLDEYATPILNWNGTVHSTCTPPSVHDNVTINRNVTLEYFKNENWYYINSTNSLPNGNWSYDWGCVCNATKLRVNYTPTTSNWYYMPSSNVINIVCPCKLTIFTQIDAFSIALSPVRVNVSNKINWTDASGKVEYYLSPGTFYVNVENTFKNRPFSHFWDSDCDKTTMNCWLDNASNPYTFAIYDRDRNITAQYKAFTMIADTKGNNNTFEFNRTYIKGRLTDERGIALIDPGNKHPKCEISATPATRVNVNRNISLEVHNNSDNKWYSIGNVTVITSDNISWSYPWNCTAGADKLRANYTPLPENWYYTSNSTEITTGCRGILDVYAFVGANQVVANVTFGKLPFGNGVADVNWDGVINSSDSWFFDSLNPNSCFSTAPGEPLWNLDCDLNLDNVSNMTDVSIIANQFGKPIYINKTHFAVELDIGTYKLRAKYDDQIKNNLSVVIDAGQTTRVYFNFLSCDGFTALDCSVPSPGAGNSRNLTGTCGRTNAKIDCDGNYNSHTVCNSTTVPGPLCSNINPSVGSYSVSSTSIIVGDSFSINVNGNCPNDLPGNCLVECRVKSPDGNSTYLNAWSKSSITTMPSFTCNQAGNYIVDYCVYATDFGVNRGWNSINNTDTNILCSVPFYTLTFKAQADAAQIALPGVQVNVNGTIKTTGLDGTVTYQLTPGTYYVSVPSQSGTRLYSHFWDSDCSQNNPGWYYDTQGAFVGSQRNYTFNMYNRDRNITAQYRTFAYITNISGIRSTFEFNGATLKGRLIDENGNAFYEEGYYHPNCENPTILNYMNIDKDVYLQAYNSSDGIWYSIGTATASAFPSNGNWSMGWCCTNPSLTKLMAKYPAQNWYYNTTNANINLGTCTVSGLVGYWKFDEGSGTTAHDSSTYHNDGTFYGETFNSGTSYSGSTPTDLHTTSGKYGKALDFDGINDFVNNSNNPSLNPQTFTVAAWISISSYPNSYPRIISKETTSTADPYALQLRQSDNSLSWCVKNGTSTEKCVVKSGLSLKTWYHVAGTFNGTHLTAYVNGIPGTPEKVLTSGLPYTIPALTTNVLIGNNPSNNRQFNGTIDEVRIFNRTLTQAEIQAEMQSSMPIVRPLASWSFEEASGNQIVDSHIWIKGKIGNALSFDGVNDYVDAGNSCILNPIANITVSAWIYAKSATTYYRIISKETSTTANPYALELINSTDIRFFIGNGTAETGTPDINVNLLNNWTHVVGTYDGQYIKIYINGQLKGQTAKTGLMPSRTAKVLIGNNPTNTRQFNGTIDEVKIWNKALNAAEVLNEYGVQTCSDGTAYNNCSSTKPYYCDAITGLLVNNYCYGPDHVVGNGDDCGCPGTDQCQTDGSCKPPTYTLTFTAQVDASGKLLSGATINVDGNPYTTGADGNGIVKIPLTAGPHTINSISSTVSGEWFSHIADFDCDGSGSNTWDVVTPYSFTMYAKARSMTAQYKSNAYIANNAGAGGTFDFNGFIISGKLLAEDGAPIFDDGYGNYHPSCSLLATQRPLNRDVILKYFDGSSWHTIPAASSDRSDTSGKWSHYWSCGVTGAKELSAEYIPDSNNWWYRGNYAIINVDSSCVPTGDLVGYWKFDEGSGTTAHDSSGYGNTGTFYGETFNDGKLGNGTVSTQPTRLSGSSCMYGNCLDFDGINDFVNASNNSVLNPQAFTLGAWVYVKSYPTTYPRIVSKETTTIANPYALEIDGTNNRTVSCVKNDTNNEICAYSPTNLITKNVWHYVTGTYNGTHLVSYTDGTPGTPVALTYTIPQLTTYVLIGNNPSNSRRFNGIIDEARIWNRSLNLTEIQAEMRSSLPVIRPLASYSFEESGNYVNDTHIWVNGTKGSALSFDGVNDYVDAGNSSVLNPIANITVSAWIYAKSATTYYRIISKETSTTANPYALELINSTDIRFFIGNGTAETGTPDINVNLLNNWTHVVGTYDGQYIKIYINGQLKGQTAKTGLMPSRTAKVLIGNNPTNTRQFNGTIDEVKIWNKALNAAEVLNEYGVKTCSDGTAYGSCNTTNKPKYCSSGTLINNCPVCGCPTGQSCNATTQACYTPATSAKSYTVYISGSTTNARNDQTGAIEFSGANSATVINSALNALTTGRTQKEKVTLIGTFMINNTIRIPSYTILNMTGSKLNLADGKNVNVIDNYDQINGNSNIEIVGGEINGNRLKQTVKNYCIDLEDISNFIIRGVYVHDCSYHGIHLINATDGLVDNCTSNSNIFGTEGEDGVFIGRASQRITVRNGVFNDNYVAGGGIGKGGGVEVRGFNDGHPTDIRIENSYFRNNGEGAVILSKYDSTVSYCCKRITISGNTMTENTGGGVWVYFANDSVVDSNQILNTKNTSAGSFGIGITVDNSSNVTVNNNVIRNSSQYGIRLRYGMSTNDKVTSNQVYENSLDGVYVETVSRNNITQNTIRDNKQNGVWLLSGSSSNNVTNNVMCNNALSNIKNDGSGNIVTPNTFSCAQYQFTVNSSKVIGTNNLSLGFHLDWERPNYFIDPSRQAYRNLAKDANFKLVRVFDYRPTSSYGYANIMPCTSWNSATKSCASWNWIMVDSLTDAIFSVGAEPLYVLGAAWAPISSRIPPGMSINSSTGLPNPDDYANYAAAWVNHFKQTGKPVRYYELLNEPYHWYDTPSPDPQKLKDVVNWWNAAARAMRAANSNILLSNDALTQKEMLDYWVNYGDNVDSLNFHKYDTGTVGQYTDTQMFSRAESFMFEDSSSWYGIDSARQTWYNRRGKWLPVMTTEFNFNYNPDPSVQSMTGSVWTSLVIRKAMLKGLNYVTYFEFSDGPNAGPELGMINYSNNKPWYPYYAQKIIGPNLAVGDSIVNSSSNYNNLSSISWIDNGKLNILLIHKSTGTKTISLSGVSGTFNYQKIDNTYPYNNAQVQTGTINAGDTITLNGYTVMLLQPPSCKGSANICPSFTDQGTCNVCKCSWPDDITGCVGTVACSSLSQTYCTACGCMWG